MVGGPPTFLETFVALDESTLPVVDGGSIALAICDTNFQATNKLALLVSHTERIGNGPLVRIVFGGPGTNANVWVEDWGVRPPTSSNPLWMNLFTVAATASPAEVSLRVIDRSTWYFRVADDDYVYADGTTSHRASRPYLRRSPYRPGMAVESGVVVRAFDSVGWSWGGRWSGVRDYQHFSASGR